MKPCLARFAHNPLPPSAVIHGNRGAERIRVAQVLGDAHGETDPAIGIPGDLPGRAKQVLFALHAPHEEETAAAA